MTVKTAARYRVDTPGLPPLFLVREVDLQEVRGRSGSAVYMLVQNTDKTETWDFWRILD